MALDASVLTVKVVSDGIDQTTTALNNLAKAGENAEAKTSKIGSGAQASAKAQVDAAQQAASAYNAIIDMMTEKSNTFYADKAMKAALAAQQEVMDQAVAVDKLNAMLAGYFQARAEQREKDRQDTLKAQQDQMDAAVAQYNKEIELMNKQFDAFQSNRAKQQVAAQAKGDALNQAGQRASDYAKLQADIKALKEETDKLAAAEKAEQAQREAIDMMAQKKRWQDEAAAVREATAAKAAADKAEQQLKADGEAFTAMLKKQADMIGMSTKEMKEYNAEQLRAKAAQLGVSQQTEEYIKKIQSAKGAHEGFSLATAGSAREVMVLGHELATGNINRFFGSLIVLGERINFLPAVLERAKDAAAAMGVSLGVLVAVVAAAVAAVGAAVVTWASSHEELKKLRAEVVLTGNAIGVTGDALYDMGNKIGAATGMYTEAYAAISKLASTGKFTASQIDLIAEAAVGVQRVGGPAIDTTIAQFEKLAARPVHETVRGFTGITDAAMELNKQLNFLDPQVLAEAMRLQSLGEYAKASEVLINSLAETEKKRVDELREKLTPFGTFMENLAVKMKAAWHDIFHEQSDEDKLKSLQSRIEDISKAHGTHVQWSPEETALLNDAAKLQAKIAADKKKADDEAAARTKKNAADEALQWLNGLYARSKGQEQADDTKMKAEKAFQLLQDAGIKTALLGAEAQKSIYEYIEKSKNKKQPKPRSDGLAGVTDEISKIQDAYDIQKNLYDNQIKVLDDLHQKKLMSDSAYTKAKGDILKQEENLEVETLDKEIKKRQSYNFADQRLREQNDKAINDLNKRLTIAKQNTQTKEKINGNSSDAFDAEAQAKADQASQQVITQTMDQVRAIQAKIDAYNSLPESVKAAGVTEKQMQDAITQATVDQYNERIASLSQIRDASTEEVARLEAERDAIKDKTKAQDEWYAAKIKEAQGVGDSSDKEVQRLTAQTATFKEKTKAQEDWEEIQAKNNAALNRSTALTKIATEQVKMWKDTGNEIEKALKNAFGNSGEAAGKMFKAFAEGQASQIDLTNQMRKVSEDKSLSEIEKEKQLTDLRLQDNIAQIGAYGNMADAASGFFEKGSTGYQAMAKAAQVLHTAEVALSIIKGVNAILTQGEGDPYTAFARMAAMTALVAGLGVAVSGGGGGPMSSANQQKVQGTGTVLGSPTIVDGVDVKLVGQKSDSIANSLKIAEKNSGLGLVVQNDMLSQLQTLNNNISSFATLAVQNSGLTGYTANTSTSGLSSALSHIPVVAGILGKIATSIFGGKTTVDDTGLKVGSASLAQVAQSGLSGSQYTNTTTSGGWFRSDKHNTDTQSLGSEFNDQITKVVLSMEDTLRTAAAGLGMGGDAFNQKLQSFVVDIGNISLKGMTGDEIQKTLQNVFSKLGDQMAQFAFSDLQKYQKIGEGLMETVVRVANDLQQVKDVFDSLSKVIPKGLDAIKTSEALISQFGSVDNLTKGVKSYISAIYTDQEKLLPIIKSVNTAMDGLGLSYVKTKEQFKQVVDSLDLTTEAGAKMFATLMNIAPAFAQTIDDTEKLANDARSALTDAYNREAQAIKDTQSKMQSLVTTLKQLSSSSLLGDLSPLTPQEKYLEAKSQFETIAAKAQGGDETAQGQFSAAYTAFLEASKVANASGAQYQKDFLYAQKVTQQATVWAEKQVDVAKATLDALNQQVEGLINVNTGLLTVSQAIANLITALKGTPEGDKVANQAASNAQSAIEKLYQNILHRASDSAGMQFWLDKIKEGVSLTDIANAIANSPEAKGEIKPIGTTSTAQAITPVTANVGTQSVSHADVITALNDVKTAITESGQTMTNKVDNLTGAVYDSQDKAADKTVTGVSNAVASTKAGSSYKIVER